MKQKYNSKGFTLIELMIVIAIIAILIAYALPAYRDYHVRTKITEGSTMAAAYKLSINQAFVRNGSLNGLNNGAFGIAGANTRGSCVSTITVTNGDITVDYDCLAGSEGTPDPSVSAAQLFWNPSPNATGGLNWDCSAITIRPDQSPCD